MADGDGHNDPVSARRWDDYPGTFEWRLLRLEKITDEAEARTRAVEAQLIEVKTVQQTIVEQLAEIHADTKETSAGSWRTFWSLVVGFILVVATVIGTHTMFK